MDTHTSSRSALKLAQEQEVAEECPETRNRSRRAAAERLRNKRVRNRREIGHARHTAETASERQATSQWKSTRKHRAETPVERETKNRSSAIRHFE